MVISIYVKCPNYSFSILAWLTYRPPTLGGVEQLTAGRASTLRTDSVTAGRTGHRGGSRDRLPLGAAVHPAADRRGTPLPGTRSAIAGFRRDDVKVAGRWVNLYRAIDQYGRIIDVLISEKRDLAATRRFVIRALKHVPARPR
jgi:hypothetical protein